MNDTVLSEEVFLPSKGLIYPKELEVPKSIVVCPFKTKDLMGLFSNSESSINTLIKNCIVGDLKINIKDLHIEDRTALFTRIRAITLGSYYNTKRECPTCHKTFEVSWDLNNIECEYLDIDEYPIPITLPASQNNISFGFVMPNEYEEIKDLIEKRKKQFPDKEFDEEEEFSFYYTACTIKRIDNIIPSLESRLEFLLELPPEDFSYLRFLINSINFGMNNRKYVTCPHCKTETISVLAITEQFFRNTYEIPAGIRVHKGILGCAPTKNV